jgi:hypothetical protein
MDFPPSKLHFACAGGLGRLLLSCCAKLRVAINPQLSIPTAMSAKAFFIFFFSMKRSFIQPESLATRNLDFSRSITVLSLLFAFPAKPLRNSPEGSKPSL